MKNSIPRPIVVAFTLLGLFSTGMVVDAAVIIEPNGKAFANFNAVNVTGNSTTAGEPTLSAPGLTPMTASVFGGEPYTYTYTPTALPDNTAFGAGTVLNSEGGLLATGLMGGTAGFYNVYHAFPQTSNATGQPTRYELLVNGFSVAAPLIRDQNISDLTNGFGIGKWELLGQVAVFNASDTITLTIDPTTTPTFTGIRTAGALFEYTGPIPEPSTAILLCAGAAVLVGRRRRFV